MVSSFLVHLCTASAFLILAYELRITASISCSCPFAPRTTRRMVASRFALTTPIIMPAPRRGAGRSDAPRDGRFGRTTAAHLGSGQEDGRKPLGCPRPLRTRRFRYRGQRFCLRCPPLPADVPVVRRFHCPAGRTPLCYNAAAALSWFFSCSAGSFIYATP